MSLRFLSAALLLSCFASLPGCGGPGENVVNAPPQAASSNVDADRAKEAGDSAANVDYSKPQ
jgi:hypothetical protein